MIIETKYNLGDTVWFYTKDGIDSGVIDTIDINTYTWCNVYSESPTGEWEIVPPRIQYKISRGKYISSGKYEEHQLWSSKEEMPLN